MKKWRWVESHFEKRKIVFDTIHSPCRAQVDRFSEISIPFQVGLLLTFYKRLDKQKRQYL